MALPGSLRYAANASLMLASSNSNAAGAVDALPGGARREQGQCELRHRKRAPHRFLPSM